MVPSNPFLTATMHAQAEGEVEPSDSTWVQVETLSLPGCYSDFGVFIVGVVERENVLLLYNKRILISCMRAGECY